MSDSLQPYGLSPARLLCPWDSPGKNTGVGSHTLLQGIFLTQVSNWSLLLSPALAGRFFCLFVLPPVPPGDLFHPSSPGSMPGPGMKISLQDLSQLSLCDDPMAVTACYGELWFPGSLCSEQLQAGAMSPLPPPPPETSVCCTVGAMYLLVE